NPKPFALFQQLSSSPPLRRRQRCSPSLAASTSGRSSSQAGTIALGRPPLTGWQRVAALVGGPGHVWLPLHMAWPWMAAPVLTAFAVKTQQECIEQFDVI
ncbi:hypothetical protein B296_00038341, partial [Ensete ventricosum]